MPAIVNYTDYRKYLKDCYEEARKSNPAFSYTVFARQAGFSSRGLLHNVINGRRNLSRENILGVIGALKLGRSEAAYFENLVAFNQARRIKERNHYFTRLSTIRAEGKTAWAPQRVRANQDEYFSNHHHSVIRSLIGMHRFSGDFEWLGRMVRPRISARQARQSVELLESLGFVRKGSDGEYELTETSITTPPEVESLAVYNFHIQSGELALAALRGLPRTQRNITGVTLGITKQGYKRICEEITEFRMRLAQIAEADLGAHAVYQLNFQFFPVSETEVTRSES